MTSPRHFTPAEIARHSTSSDLWIIIDGDVYDLSTFTAEHPGGPKVLLGVAGKDATKMFHKFHRDSVLRRYRERFWVGTVEWGEEGRRKSRGRFSFRALLKR
ncbi:Cytochrome b5 [Aspergillus sp. HF37]|nr:Cytochrome b5 [Aspergillus sp. HF37]